MAAVLAQPETAAPTRAPLLRELGRSAYADTYARMREFTAARDAATPDEIWLTEHEPVYTLGTAGREDHVRDTGGVPVLRCDRGGQVTYHGPGQAVAYVMVDLPRRGLTVRGLVRLIEEAQIATLADEGIAAARRDGMPGVYVGLAKIGALGLRVRHGRSYHGASLNVDLDLAAFDGIDTCGYPGLASTSMSALGSRLTVREAGTRLGAHLARLIEQHPTP